MVTLIRDGAMVKYGRINSAESPCNYAISCNPLIEKRESQKAQTMNQNHLKINMKSLKIMDCTSYIISLLFNQILKWDEFKNSFILKDVQRQRNQIRLLLEVNTKWSSLSIIFIHFLLIESINQESTKLGTIALTI